jgi:AbrB family looped-hinge helix DNA binding protein
MAREILGTSRLSHKFQVTIPKEVRERFELGPADLVVFYEENGKLVLGKSKET